MTIKTEIHIIFVAAMVFSGCATGNQPSRLSALISAINGSGAPIFELVEDSPNYILQQIAYAGDCIMGNETITVIQLKYIRKGTVPRGDNFIVFQDSNLKVLGIWITDSFYNDLSVIGNHISIGDVPICDCVALFSKEKILVDGKLQPPMNRPALNQRVERTSEAGR